ncbi:sigma-54 dependent transcriptional regulator [bacterium]|nr:sigma-54 dependent transcriptional regulator [bacterium]
MSRVLIVDDEESICWGLKRLAEGLGCTSLVVSSAEQACIVANREPIDLAIVDVRLPDMDGLSLMRRLQSEGKSFPFIVITAYGDLGTAVGAIQGGAFDYIAKPFDVITVERAVTSALSLRSGETAEGPYVPRDADLRKRIVGSSPALQAVFKQVAMVAETEASVHLFGESGTGKELIARSIHEYSRRKEGPFVVVHAAAINMALAESELFGHVRGAFTGAEQTRAGLLEQANGGTLFFDEVADIPVELQVKLLRAIEYGEIVPVGSNRPIRTDFRVISASHRDLRQSITNGSFREDLFFRLGAYMIEIPPLRTRVHDIRELTLHFVQQLSDASGNPSPPVSDDAVRDLEGRHWRGNVRELRNVIEHALIVARGNMIRPEHLPPSIELPDVRAGDAGHLDASIESWLDDYLTQNSVANDVHARLLDRVERILFEEVLHRHQGNFASAARQLGLHRVTLKRKMDEFGS